MLRRIARILTVGLALVGLGTLAEWAWPVVRGAPPAPDYLSFVGSPDGDFKAVLASWNGGGAVAPYCYQRVFVVPQATPADRLPVEEFVVFEGDCGTFAEKDGRVLNSPELIWREPKVLAIRFSTNTTAVEPATFRLRRLVSGGRVAVEFEVGH